MAGPAARIPGPSPNATNGAISCATRREAWVTGFDCGVGVGGDLNGPYPPVRRSRPYLVERSGVLALFPPREPNRGTGRPKSITRPENNRTARRRGELDRDRGSRRISQAVDALRRLNARRAASTRTTADPLGPSDPRHARSDQDEDRGARKARRWPRHRDPNT